jgi:nucleotide-binding universal stress UspA family protein
MKIKRILVPVDLSSNSLAALDYVADFAKPYRAEVVALFILEPDAYAAMGTLYGAAAEESAKLVRDQEAFAREELVKLAKAAKRRMPKFRTLVRAGSPATTIVSQAQKLGADLIAMATHGRSGLTRMLLGSVAEKVVRTAPCPVLTVRPAKTKGRRKARPKAARKTARTKTNRRASA